MNKAIVNQAGLTQRETLAIAYYPRLTETAKRLQVSPSAMNQAFLTASEKIMTVINAPIRTREMRLLVRKAHC